MPRPLDSTVSHSSEPQTAQAGSGGWRSVPHEVQCWMSRRVGAGALEPEGVVLGMRRARARRAAAPSSGGRYLRIRKRMVATGSPAS